MEQKEKDIYKALDRFTRIRFNHLKKFVVDEKKLMSERPFRETLKQMVKKGMVKKIEIEKQHVEYTTKFDDLEYEKQVGKYFEDLISNYDKLLTKFIDKRQRMSKLEQVNIIISFLKSIYLIEFWFKEFVHARNNPKIKSLKIKFTDVKDLAESIAVDTGEGADENHDIYELANRMMVSESLDMFDQIKRSLR